MSATAKIVTFNDLGIGDYFRFRIGHGPVCVKVGAGIYLTPSVENAPRPILPSERVYPAKRPTEGNSDAAEL